MAGIGFALRRAYRTDSLAGRAGAGVHATIVAAGPWLFAIACIGTISWYGTRVSGIEVMANFRVATIYAFSISLVLTSPIAIVATRVVADALFTRRFEDISGTFVAALSLTALLAVPLSAAVFLFFCRDDPAYVLAATACTVAAALVWTAMGFCGALKEFRRITLAFLLGFAVAAVGGVVLAARGFGAPAMLAAFACGLILTFLVLASRVLGAFEPATRRAILAGAAGILKRHRPLALGGLFGALAIWIDKWVFWTLRGEHAASGLAHSPLYDSAMFIGCLAIIPSLASFVVNLETVLFRQSRGYLGAVLGHRTLRNIEAERVRLERKSLLVLHRTLLVQLSVTAVFVLLAPLFVEFLQLQFSQLSIFRFSAMGAGFQFLFFACSAIVVFFDRQWMFVALQGLFLSANLVLTWLFIQAGPDWDGMGYLTAAVVSGVVAYFAALHTLSRLNYLIFIGNNRAL